VTLTHNPANSDSNFLGYDVYYRAYGTLADADTARISIENAANLTTSTPEGVLSQMTSLGFKKIYLYPNYSVPPTPLFSGSTTYTIQTIGGTISTNWYYVTTSSAVHIQIIRATGNSNVPYDSFNYQYGIGDSDYASTTMGVTAGNPVFIVAFAVAYGFDFTKLTPIYSFPASLYQEIGGSSGYQLPTSP
jgi:hypothetical protein